MTASTPRSGTLQRPRPVGGRQEPARVEPAAGLVGHLEHEVAAAARPCLLGDADHGAQRCGTLRDPPRHRARGVHAEAAVVADAVEHQRVAVERSVHLRRRERALDPQWPQRRNRYDVVRKVGRPCRHLVEKHPPAAELDFGDRPGAPRTSVLRDHEGAWPSRPLPLVGAGHRVGEVEPGETVGSRRDRRRPGSFRLGGTRPESCRRRPRGRGTEGRRTARRSRSRSPERGRRDAPRSAPGGAAARRREAPRTRRSGRRRRRRARARAAGQRRSTRRRGVALRGLFARCRLAARRCGRRPASPRPVG